MPAGKPLLDVLLGRTPSRRPLWFMRQAGRYLPEYRKVREQAGSFVNLCYDPAGASEVTLQPLRRYDLDAAIIFSDILVVPHALGCDLDFKEGEGPRLSIIDSMAGVNALGDVKDAWQVSRLQDALKLTRPALPANAALIGFCGAPWTVASYMIEGGTSDERLKARRAALEQPAWFQALMRKLIDASVDYLALQVEAGAEALQVFDSWAGELPANVQSTLVVEPLREIRERVVARVGDVPFIMFARGLGQGHAAVAARTGANAIGLEQGVDLAWAREAIPCAVQGNLDPLALACGGRALDDAVDGIVAALPPERHIFNLGHGVRQETDPGNVTRMIARVRARDAEKHG